MSDTLRNAIIKLAYDRPEFRADLLPLVKIAFSYNGQEVALDAIKSGAAGNGYTFIEDGLNVDAAATSDYQRDLLRGVQAWSGSTLQGAQKKYSGKYAVTRKNLLERLAKLANITEVKGKGGKIIKVLTKKSTKVAEKTFRFPEGTMSMRDWITDHADRVESYYPTLDEVLDRKKWNRMDGDAQDAYEEKMEKLTKKLRYRASKSDVFHEISKADFEWAQKNGIQVKR